MDRLQEVYEKFKDKTPGHVIKLEGLDYVPSFYYGDLWKEIREKCEKGDNVLD